MRHPLIAKLNHGALLTEEDEKVILRGLSPSREVEAGSDIIREGGRPDRVNVVMAGLACRYKVLPDGRRHIMAYLIPGDFCDLHVAILGEMDHAIGTLTHCQMATISTETVALWTLNPRINHALWWATLVDQAVLREWLVNMGARQAPEAMAHFACELLIRMQSVGLASANGFRLPLTQAELGDTLGLSVVHTNRVVRSLRHKGLVTFSRGQVQIADVHRLKEFASFNPNYLHLNGSPLRIREVREEGVRAI